MLLPCDRESEEESGQADSDIAAVNVHLDSVDGEGTAPEEKELPGEEEQSTPVPPGMPFNDLDFTFLSDSVMVEQIHAPTLESPGYYDQVRSIAELLRGYSFCLPVIGSGFICQKGRSARYTNGRAREGYDVGHHLL
jgi:hypothetical protein